MQRGSTPSPYVLLFARRSTTPTTARRYRGPRRGQGRSSSRALHLDRGCGPQYQAAAAGRNPQGQQPTIADDAVDIFIRGVDQFSDLEREEPVAESRNALVRPELISTPGRLIVGIVGGFGARRCQEFAAR